MSEFDFCHFVWSVISVIMMIDMINSAIYMAITEII